VTAVLSGPGKQASSLKERFICEHHDCGRWNCDGSGPTELLVTYKILFGRIDVTVSDFFTFADQEHNTRGHSCKLLGGQCRVNARQHYFAERVVNVCNSLNVQPNNFRSLQAFKRCIIKQDLGDFIICA
jgi:hypothetical protein